MLPDLMCSSLGRILLICILVGVVFKYMKDKICKCTVHLKHLVSAQDSFYVDLACLV